MWKIILTALVGAVVASAAFRKNGLRENLAIIRQYRLRHLTASVLVIAVVGAISWELWTAAPVFRLNPLLWVFAKLFHDGTGQGQGNLIFSGLNWKWYAVVFLPVLALALPRLARYEEETYRAGTRDWQQGALRSLRFGLAHMFMLIPFGASLALSVAGLWFTFQYFRGAASVPALPAGEDLPPGVASLREGLHAQIARQAGVRRSTIYHAAFNTTLVAALFVIILAAS